MGKKTRVPRSAAKPLRTPGKRYSESQEIGRSGQEFFSRMCSRIGLIPIPAEGLHDVGIDFICQRRGAFVGGSAPVLGDFIAAPVRATTTADARVLLSRDDAAHMLQTNMPVLFALVVVAVDPADDRIYCRALDETFADELLTFLDSEHETRSYTPNSPGFAKIGEVAAVVDALSAPGFAARVRLHGLTHRARKYLSDARISVQHDAGGSVSLVYTERFADAFDVSRDDGHAKLLDAVFGHGDELEERLRTLKIKPELLELRHDLPGPVIFQGTIPHADTILVARGEGGKATLHVEWRDAPGWSGFSHRSGFSFRISERTPHEDHHVHFVKVALDPKHPLDLRVHPDLEAFLALCIDGNEVALVEDDDAPGLAVGCCDDLRPLGAFVAARRLAAVGEDTHEALHVLTAVPTVESINTLFFWAGAKEREWDEPWGYAIDREATMDDEPIEVVLPVCANVGDAGFVIWARSSVRLLRHEGAIAGLAVSTFEIAGVEDRPRFEGKATKYPELVITPDWPSIPLADADLPGTRDVSSWDCAMVRMADLDPPADEEETSERSS